MELEFAKVNISVELQNDIKKIPNLTSNIDMLATEGITDIIKSIGTTIKNKFTSFIQIFSNAKSIFNNNGTFESVKYAYKRRKYAIKAQKVLNYSTLKNVELPVTLGFDVSVVEAINLMEKPIKGITKNLFDFLEDIDSLVSNTISNPEYLESSVPAKINKIKEIKNEIEDINKAVYTIINPQNTKEIKKFEELYPNISSVNDNIERLYNLTKGIDNKALEAITSKINTIEKKVKELTNIIKDNKELKINKKVLNSLADDIETAAKYVTSVSYFFYTIVNVGYILNATLNELEDRI